MINALALFLQCPFILAGVIYGFIYDGFITGLHYAFETLGYQAISEDDDEANN